MKLICVQDNYELYEEKQNITSQPVFFLKPESALLINNQPFFIPEHAQQIIPKINVAIKICRLGKNIQEKFAYLYFDEISIGLDMEAADTLEKCTNNGLPWETAKAYDSSAPIGNFFPKKEIIDLSDINFSLYKNGNPIVKANSSQMIFSFDKIISYVSTYITLKTGDYIFTGSPHSIASVSINDKLECFIEDKKLLRFNVK
jgi:acylpyruvate hydrolase